MRRLVVVGRLVGLLHDGSTVAMAAAVLARAPARRGRSPRPEWRSAWCGSCCRPPRWRSTSWTASTSPSSPSLLMRTGELSLLAPYWCEVASDSRPGRSRPSDRLLHGVVCPSRPMLGRLIGAVLVAGRRQGARAVGLRHVAAATVALHANGGVGVAAQHCVESADESADWSLYAFWLASCTTGHRHHRTRSPP